MYCKQLYFWLTFLFSSRTTQLGVECVRESLNTIHTQQNEHTLLTGIKDIFLQMVCHMKLKRASTSSDTGDVVSLDIQPSCVWRWQKKDDERERSLGLRRLLGWPSLPKNLAESWWAHFSNLGWIHLFLSSPFLDDLVCKCCQCIASQPIEVTTCTVLTA